MSSVAPQIAVAVIVPGRAAAPSTARAKNAAGNPQDNYPGHQTPKRRNVKADLIHAIPFADKGYCFFEAN